MEKKTIEFTNEEYRKLVKLIFLGEWVLNAHHDEAKHVDEKELVNKIYSQNKKYKYEKAFNKFDDEFELKDTKVMKFMEDIREFTEDEFWEALCGKLAVRDMGEILLNNETLSEEMTNEEFFEMQESIMMSYQKEFEEGGFAFLRLTNSFDPKDN